MNSETYPIGALASKTIHFNSYSRSSEESTTPIVDRISPIPTKSFDSHLSTSRTVREWLLDSLGIISFVFHYDCLSFIDCSSLSLQSSSSCLEPSTSIIPSTSSFIHSYSCTTPQSDPMNNCIPLIHSVNV